LDRAANRRGNPSQNSLAVALRELGRIQRTPFILDWLRSVELHRHVHAGLNKGEARNALARTVFFNRLGEIRDRELEQQRYLASGLNLLTAAIVLWNMLYLERVANALRSHGQSADDVLLQYLSPLGWEHQQLPVAQQHQGRCREVLAAASCLTYFYFLFLRRPLISQPHPLFDPLTHSQTYGKHQVKPDNIAQLCPDHRLLHT